MKSLVIVGKRWFQKTYGNTYHTVRIIVDGKCVQNVGRTYGYGTQYEQTAAAWLEENGYIKLTRYGNGGSEALWQCMERMKVSYHSEAIDVERKKDL